MNFLDFIELVGRRPDKDVVDARPCPQAELFAREVLGFLVHAGPR